MASAGRDKSHGPRPASGRSHDPRPASDLSHDLHVWLMNEMQYDASGADGHRAIPTPENLAQLFVGELPDVWKYLMENVYGPHSIHAVKGNLQLCRGRHGARLVSSPEEKSLQGRKETLTKDLRQVNSSIEHLEGEIAKLEEEIINKTSSVRQTREACRREQRLAACHRLQSERCAAEMEALSALTARLGRLAGDQEAGEREADGQTACMRQISEATELLAGHIDRSLERAPGSCDSLARAERCIGLTVQRHPPEDILRSLAGLQQRAGLQLARKLQEGEGEANGETVTDEQRKSSSTDPVTQQIQRSTDELHALHVTWRVEELTAAREAGALRRQLQRFTGQLASRQLQDPSPVDWAAQLSAVEAQGRAVAMETAVRQLTGEVAALGEAREALEQRYATIQHNQQLIERNKSHIQLLVSLSGDSLSLTRSAQQRAAAAAQQRLSPLLADLTAAQQRLKGGVTAEAEMVARRVVEDLRWMVVDGRPVLSAHLPIYRAPPDPARCLSRRLRLPEAELLALLEALWERQRTERRDDALKEMAQEMGEMDGDGERLEECRRRVQSQTEHERTTLMPQLERLFVNMSQMGAALKQARNALHNWTDQPARTAIQQVQHGGQTLRQWEQRYMAAAASSRPTRGQH